MDDFEQFLNGWDKANVIPVVGKMPADLLTPLAVYLKLAAGRPNAFLLESVEGGENLARYSFIGADADTLLQADGPDTRIRSGAKESTEQIWLWEYLKRHFEGLHLADERDFPSFTGGAMGYFGFDCFSWFEPAVPAVAADGPAAEVMLFRSIVAFDHVRQSINLVTLVFRDEVEEAGPRSAYEQAVLKNNEIRRTLDEPFFNLPAPQPALSDPDVRSNWDPARF